MRVRVRRQHDDVADVLQRLSTRVALARVALPAVVREGVQLQQRHLVHDHLERRRRGAHRLEEGRELACAEHRPVGSGDLVEARLRHRLGQRRSDLRERLAHGEGCGRGEIVAAGRSGLGAPERPLVEEEELDVPSPAEGAVQAGGRRVRDGRVVGEGLHAGAVDRVAVLRAGEVVDELVVVPVAVEAGGGAQPPQRGERQPEAVLLPLGRDRAGDRRATDLGVRVDRVAEVDVEEVVLLCHPAVRLEMVEGRLAGRAGCRVGVTGDGEADGGRQRPRAAP